MGENKDYDAQVCDETVKGDFHGFFRNIANGICIGIAFIIPGFSGGTVAVLLGIYESLIEAVAGIFKHIKLSLQMLIPIGIGMAIGISALIFPLVLLLERFPLPTVSFFIGLAIGAIPTLKGKIQGRFNQSEIFILILSLSLALLMCFLPIGTGEIDLFSLDFGGYTLLFIVGAVVSCALVIPGISGSMLMLILGYYNPILKLITDNLFRFNNVLQCLSVLTVCAAGIGVGFLLVSALMRYLLGKYPRLTYFSIIGFIIGSLPTVYVSVMKSAGMLSENLGIIYLPISPFHYAVCLFLIMTGISVSAAFSVLTVKNNSKDFIME